MTKKPHHQQGLAVHPPGSAEGQRILARHALDTVQLEKALAIYEATEKVRVAVCIGVHEMHGLFFSSDPLWRPDRPDAFDGPIGAIPWVQIKELLGRLPEGSAQDYLHLLSKGNIH